MSILTEKDENPFIGIKDENIEMAMLFFIPIDSDEDNYDEKEICYMLKEKN